MILVPVWMRLTISLNVNFVSEIFSQVHVSEILVVIC